MKARCEYTDTFGQEANYTWVRRTEIEAAGLMDLTRKAKRWAGLTGVTCLREQSGDLIQYRPYGMCTVLFVEIMED